MEERNDVLSVKKLAAQVWARISPPQPKKGAKREITPETIILRLKNGNRRYMTSETGTGNISPEKRLKTATNGQHPYAVVVTCSDSRVIPEEIFAAGIGELFIVRAAGNVMGDHQIGSIIYAVEHLKCKMVIVMGHTQCGAVAATLEGGAEGYVKYLTDEVKEAIGSETDSYIASCLNVRHGMKKLQKAMEEDGVEVKIAGALYDISDGHVEWLDIL